MIASFLPNNISINKSGIKVSINTASANLITDSWRKFWNPDTPTGSFVTDVIRNGWYYSFNPLEGIGVTVHETKDTLAWAGAEVLGNIIHLFTYVFNKILTIVGNLFDWSIRFAILNIGSGTYGGLMEAVGSVWTIFRDTFNILFIFLLLWVAIKTILQIDSSGAKKMITSIVIAAVLINFSLFITKIVIDVSNILTLAVYNKILEVSVDARNLTLPQGASEDIKRSISNTIITGLGMPAQYNSDNTELKINEESITQDLIKLITTGVVIWVLFVASMLFIVRLATFFILMAISPIGFIGGVIPSLDKQASDWKSELTNQAILAPMFLFFLLIAIKVMKTGLLLIGNNSQKGVGLYFNFFVVIFLLLYGLKKAKSLSGTFSDMISSGAKLAGGFALGAATGGLAMAGRAGIGRLAGMAANNDKLKAAAAAGGIGGFASRMVLKGADKTSKSSFDIRNTGVGGLIRKTGVDMGKGGGKDGFVGMRDEYAKKRVAEAKMMERDLDSRSAAAEVNAAKSAKLGEKEREKEKAVNELKNLKTEKEKELAEATTERQDLVKEKFSSGTTKERSAEIDKEIKELEKQMKQFSKETANIDKQITQKQGETITLNKGEISEIESETKTAYQKMYADSIQNSVIGQIRGYKYNKVAANKIRKEVVGGKSAKEQAAEALKRLKDEEDKASGATTASSTPPTPPPANNPRP